MMTDEEKREKRKIRNAKRVRKPNDAKRQALIERLANPQEPTPQPVKAPQRKPTPAVEPTASQEPRCEVLEPQPMERTPEEPIAATRPKATVPSVPLVLQQHWSFKRFAHRGRVPQ